MALVPNHPVTLVGPKGDEFRCYYTVDMAEKLAEGYKVKGEEKPVVKSEPIAEEKKPRTTRPARRMED